MDCTPYRNISSEQTSSSPFSFSNSLFPGTLAHEWRAAGKLYMHSRAPLLTGLIPLCVRECRDPVRAMTIFCLSCALATNRMPFATMWHNRLQLDENRPVCMTSQFFIKQGRIMTIWLFWKKTGFQSVPSACNWTALLRQDIKRGYMCCMGVIEDPIVLFNGLPPRWSSPSLVSAVDRVR